MFENHQLGVSVTWWWLPQLDHPQKIYDIHTGCM